MWSLTTILFGVPMRFQIRLQRKRHKYNHHPSSSELVTPAQTSIAPGLHSPECRCIRRWTFADANVSIAVCAHSPGFSEPLKCKSALPGPRSFQREIALEKQFAMSSGTKLEVAPMPAVEQQSMILRRP
jgi:hypothetical protein